MFSVAIVIVLIAFIAAFGIGLSYIGFKLMCASWRRCRRQFRELENAINHNAARERQGTERKGLDLDRP